VTPAERDEVRAGAQAVLDYVPASNASHPAVQVVDVEPDLPPAFRLSVVLYGQFRMQPAEARSIAHALHAAADAAEES